MGNLYKGLTIFITSRSVLFKMRNVVDKICRDNRNEHFIFSIPPDDHAVYEIMRTSIEVSNKPQMIIWRMRIACCKPKTTHTHTHTHTHSKYVALTALPLKKWLHGSAGILRYKCDACLVELLHLRCREFPSKALNVLCILLGLSNKDKDK